MIVCIFCQHVNPVDAKFCERCRADLRVSSRDDEAAPIGELPPPTPGMPATEALSRVPIVERASLGPTEISAKLLAKALAPQPQRVNPGETFEAGPLQALPLPKPMIEPLSPTAFAREIDPVRPLVAPPTQFAGNVMPPAPEVAPPTNRPRLRVLRGERINYEYQVYEGRNFIGRTDEKPVDIDLSLQEPRDCVWSSRQHAVILLENGTMTIEDLNSLNGTFVNRTRVHPGQQRLLQVGDVIQIGTVQMKVVVG